MSTVTQLPPTREPRANDPLPLGVRAEENLRFIRETMERAAAFTSVSGWAQAGIGLLALGSAVLAARQPTVERWLAVWIATATVSLAISAVAFWRKARAAGLSVVAPASRPRVVGFAAPVAAAAALTLALYRADATAVIPGMWLLLYGVGVLAGGMLSVKLLPVMGLCSVALGLGALATPADWADWWMAAGFGALHIGFGLVIVRRYGG